MYKQCFELLTAQGKCLSLSIPYIGINLSVFITGPKPQKSFSVSTGAPEVAKDFDAEIKGNIFILNNQRLQLPPNPAQMSTDFHNTGSGVNASASKRVGVAQSLNIVHQFLVFQIFVPQGEPFSIELTVRDKHNVSKSQKILC